MQLEAWGGIFKKHLVPASHWVNSMASQSALGMTSTFIILRSIFVINNSIFVINKSILELKKC